MASDIFASRAFQLVTAAQGGIFIQWLDSFQFPLCHICFIAGRKSFGRVSIADFLQSGTAAMSHQPSGGQTLVTVDQPTMRVAEHQSGGLRMERQGLGN